MVTSSDFGQFETAWCPGCGNHAILKAVKEALAGMDKQPRDVCLVSGIGQAAKTPHYMLCNLFNGLHGRALPVATGIKLANPGLDVIAESGDGCMYGEGGNHFLAAVRRNINLTLLVHNNQIYGLTKGQASPTTATGQTTKAQPHGAYSAPFAPLSTALSLGAGFVARGFSGMTEHLVSLIQTAVRHPGFALVDILQPCVSFNKVNTHSWYKERCTELDDSHDAGDWEAAMRLSMQWGETIPVGILYQNTDRGPFEGHFPQLEPGPLADNSPSLTTLESIMQTYA
ncbi:2-oxoacid:ferredoxin oxidoreductase subunit beta [Desulfovermiculus halophilus]|jgi:2-oxoglutarate ferredoxin oxidoreductase subunit beta|uniref:2-oxoacid:ferredoxin oxidoreductase subunit beta n=1 Tax=Desulfovermiculus halophilus TaxID=339722 RepID=UPI000480D1C9|nr:2-oxoacid:ferredoxin oxidoreductase subunit beta [Desulfovermiculus halophilus]